MRKEIAGILLFFLVVLTLVSLLSYSPEDPSIHNATAGSQIHNLFGLIGSHLAGLLIGLFGLGAFWIPVLLMLGSIHLFGRQPLKNIYILITLIGSLILVITSGSLFSIKQDHYLFFGNKFSSGGMIGIPFKSLLFKYANPVGGMLILIVLWIIGLIMSTGLSLLSFFKYFFRALKTLGAKINATRIILRGKAKKTKEKQKPDKIQKDPQIPQNDPIRIITTPPQPIKQKPQAKTGNL
jgi:DNA segregation ATPase FtsK/SpoIIIE, S-DNA-T family